MTTAGDVAGGDALRRTLRQLARAAKEHEHVVVAYSGGKDSEATLDLCKRSFRKVSAFYMYLVPGLVCIEQALAAAEARHRVPIAKYPHWIISRVARAGVYLPPLSKLPPEWKLDDIYAMAMEDTGATVLATGARLGDSQWRRRQMATWGKKDAILYPISHWNKLQVLGYLRVRGIPIPPSSGKSATGIDLSEPSLLWLHDTYPNDFARLLRHYPLAEGVIKRREFFGTTEHRTGSRAATAQA